MSHRLLGVCLGAAALLGTPGLAVRCLAKPPDLPANQRIILVPQHGSQPETRPVPAQTEQGVWVDLSEGEVPAPVRKAAWLQALSEPFEVVWSAPTNRLPAPAPTKVQPRPLSREMVVPLLFAVHPFVALLSEDAPPFTDPAPQAPAPKNEVAGPVGAPTCPHLRQQQQQLVGRPGSVPALPSALDNLDKLQRANASLETARALFRAGKVAEGLEHLQQVRTLCPGSSYEARANQVMEELFAGVFITPGEEASEEQESVEPTLATNAVADACDGLFAGFRSLVQGAEELCGLPGLLSACPCTPTKRIEALVHESGYRRATSGDVASRPTGQEVFLDTRISLDYTNAPLGAVLDDLTGCQVVPVVIDLGSLHDAGVSLGAPVTVKADNLPYRVAMDLVLRPKGLTCAMNGGALVVSAAKPGPNQNRSRPGEEESEDRNEGAVQACPKAQALHAKHCKAAETQVRGLMKACHLALSEGHHQKAADLARQAHALDPKSVEADPVVYKLHLTAYRAPSQIRERGAQVAVDSCPALTGGPSTNRQVTPKEPAQASCPDAMLVPCLPPLDHRIVAALDAVLREKEKAPCQQGMVDVRVSPLTLLTGTLDEWRDAFTYGKGQMQFGLNLTGWEIHYESKANGHVYHAILGTSHAYFWKHGQKKGSEEAAEADEGDKR